MPDLSSNHIPKQETESLKNEIQVLKKNIADLQSDIKRFQSIFNNMHEIYFEVDLKGNLTHFNPALCNVLGYLPEQLQGKNNRDYTSPATAEQMFQTFNKIYRTGEPADITDYRMIRKDGEVRHLELSTYLIRDEKGEPSGFHGIGRDVTARIEAEKKLNESEDRFYRLNELSFSGILIHENGIILDCNAELCRMTGYDYPSIIGMRTLDLCAPEFHPLVIKKMETSNENPYEIVIFKKDRSRLPVEIHAKNIPYNGKKARIVEIRNMSERKKAEDALKRSRIRYRQLYKEAQKSEELYQSLLNSSADAILLMDTEFLVQFVNPSFTKIFGWTRSEMAENRPQYIPKPLKQKFDALLRQVLESDHPMHGFETQRYTKDRRLLDVSISASRYLDHGGEANGILLILRDISDTKRYQWHMEQAQRMESLGTLASGIAHDFNNLLMGMQGRLSLLMLKKSADGPSHEHLKEIEDYVVRASTLTQQMLGVARSGKYEVKSTDINELIKTQNRMFGRTRKEITIHEHFDTARLTAEVDARQIDQVILNMYVNASHAMQSGGDLYIRTANEILDKALVARYGVEPGTYVKISITDTGSGMDKTTLKRIFEPFFSTKPRGRGTGLGLASAYGIIKNHDGFITVYSEIGKGTTFNIFLPASNREAEQEALINTEVVGGSGMILLVDDEEMILQVAREMIEVLGYQTLIAHSGREAIDIYKEKKEQLGMIILDMIMPGMGGGEVFDQLRTIDSDVRVLLSSGYSIDGQAAAILKRGCRGFIQKPFSIQALSQKISQVMESNPDG